MKSYSFFAGCTIPNVIPSIEAATRRVMEKLGIELVDLPFGCCPDPTGVQGLSHDAWLVLGARNIALAEQEGKGDIMTICNGCFETLKTVNHHVREDPKEREMINSHLQKVNRKIEGKLDVRSFLEVLEEDIGLEEIKKHITTPLDQTVGIHYGCHILKPKEILKYDNPDRPERIERLLEALGIKTKQYVNKSLCCGAGILGIDGQTTLGIRREKLVEVEKAGIDWLVTPCPTCLRGYDSSQMMIKKEFGDNLNIPVLHISELLALVMGFPANEIGLNFHRVKDPSWKK
ncbi:MAG: CoB--CoM heterodisulfide reductase iron-sulfur subunit B family protein [Promethearchaeota archaeon]